MGKILFVLATLIILGCNALNVNRDGVSNEVIDSSEIIDASNAFKSEEIEIEDYLHDIKIIKLETTDMSILSDIRQLLVTKKYIYVKDSYKNGGVAIFDIYGKFVKRLPNGAAPHEIGRAGAMCVESKSGNLFILDQAAYKILEFSADGEYINNYYVGKMVGDVAVEKNRFLFVQRGIQNESGYFVLSLSDRLLKSFTDLYLGEEPFAFMRSKYIEKCGDGYNVMLPWVNTVYCYKKGNMFRKFNIKNKT